MLKIIAYYRVSTKRQGKSGLGLDGQREAVESYARHAGGKIVGEYVEIETGTNKRERPELTAATGHCNLIGGKLVVAKLDRLARNVAFMSALMESGVDFVAVDNPTANKLTIHILAAVAENEAEAISHRTKSALQAAKRRGVKLGSARPGHWRGREDRRQAGLEKARQKSIEARKRAARNKLAFLFPKLRELRDEGTSYGRIAARLNAEGFTTARGKQWTATAAQRAYRLAQDASRETS